MKRNIYKITVPVILALLLCQCSPLSKRAEERRERREKEIREGYAGIKEMVHSGLYEFIAKHAYPMAYSPVDITSSIYYLRVRYYDVKAYLPFFGRRHTANIGRHSGIKIDAKLQDLMIEERDGHHRVLVTFNVPGEADKYRITMDIGPEGDTRLTVVSSKTSTISFYGKVSPIEPGNKENEQDNKN